MANKTDNLIDRWNQYQWYIYYSSPNSCREGMRESLSPHRQCEIERKHKKYESGMSAVEEVLRDVLVQQFGKGLKKNYLWQDDLIDLAKTRQDLSLIPHTYDATNISVDDLVDFQTRSNRFHFFGFLLFITPKVLEKRDFQILKAGLLSAFQAYRIPIQADELVIDHLVGKGYLLSYRPPKCENPRLVVKEPSKALPDVESESSRQSMAELYLTQVGSKVIFVPQYLIIKITDHSRSKEEILEEIREPIKQANPHQPISDEELKLMTQYSNDGIQFIPFTTDDLRGRRY